MKKRSYFYSVRCMRLMKNIDRNSRKRHLAGYAMRNPGKNNSALYAIPSLCDQRDHPDSAQEVNQMQKGHTNQILPENCLHRICPQCSPRTRRSQRVHLHTQDSTPCTLESNQESMKNVPHYSEP